MCKRGEVAVRGDRVQLCPWSKGVQGPAHLGEASARVEDVIYDDYGLDTLGGLTALNFQLAPSACLWPHVVHHHEADAKLGGHAASHRHAAAAGCAHESAVQGRLPQSVSDGGGEVPPRAELVQNRVLRRECDLRLVVQIQCQIAVGPSALHATEHQLHRNASPRIHLPVLPCILQAWHHDGQPIGRLAFQRIDAEHQLHERESGLCRGIASREKDEHIMIRHGLLDLDGDLPVVEC
mmetsp:Transcript_57599/g.166749  ORF Transcript_57599/g.166749 Transcript_57599/m.166749 type:complete len:237 (+) Transcript_57599:382-1092(+)